MPQAAAETDCGDLEPAEPTPPHSFASSTISDRSETGTGSEQANELCAEPHNRMPVVLGPETWPAWLGEEPADPRQLKAMLAPYPSEEMTYWPVGTRVGNVKNNDPSLIEPISAR